MNDFAEWLAGNERYVKLLVETLIARLERYATTHEEARSEPVVVTDAPPEEGTARRKFGLFSKRAPEATVAELVRAPRIGHEKTAAPPQGQAESATQSQTEADLAALETMQPPPALRLLQQRFSLTDFERQTLLLCAALEFDARVSSLCARVSSATGQPAPSFALALDLFEDPSWDAIAPDRPLLLSTAKCRPAFDTGDTLHYHREPRARPRSRLSCFGSIAGLALRMPTTASAFRKARSAAREHLRCVWCRAWKSLASKIAIALRVLHSSRGTRRGLCQSVWANCRLH